MQSLIENTKKPADDPPSVDEPDNEDRNLRIQTASLQDNNSHIPHTPRQSFSHNQNGNPSLSNSPPHNFPSNDHLRNQVNNDQPTSTYDSSPCQTINLMPVASTGASPTTPFSNKGSFNRTIYDHSGQVHTGQVNHNHYYFQGCTIVKRDETQDHTGININQEEHEPGPPLSYCVGVPLLS